MIKRLCAIGAVGLALLLTACGGGGGSSGSTASTSSTPAPPALTNFATLTVDGGPNGASYNTAYVSVTICAPGSTSNCQTIDHVRVDTGSTGLRILASVITPSLLAAMPTETDASSNPVGECYGGFGAVRQADFKIGGESVANMPFQAIGDTAAFTTLPSACTGSEFAPETIASLGANGVIGVGSMATDCDAACTTPGGSGAATTGASGAAIYYVCPSSGCAVIARAASTTAPFQQLPNPVAAMSIDNNGTVISLPAAPAAGEATTTGTIYFGIGTESNNGLGSANAIATTTQTIPDAPGTFTVNYGSTVLNGSSINSGNPAYSFVNFSSTNVTACIYSVHDPFQAVFCPSSPVTLDVTLEGTSSVTASTSITISNFNNFASNYAVRPGIGYSSTVLDATSSVVFGLPFFYGRNVYTAIENRAAGSATGPYVAF